MKIKNCIVLTEEDKKKIENGKVSEYPRMKDNQIRTAKALIRDTCCNYDASTGGCLLLDRGEVIPCPQMLTHSLCCRYFREALLEDKRARELKAEIFDDGNRKICAACGGHFLAVSNRAKYCTKCAREQQKKKATERKRKQRGYVTL